MHQLTKEQARRIAVRAQLLDAPRPTELLTVVQRLTLLQIDPTSAIAPSADLVAWSRLGSAYEPAELKSGAGAGPGVFELDAMVRPMSDLGLYLAGAAEWPSYDKQRDWLRDNDRFRRDILELLRTSGPVSSRDIPDTCVVPWASTGWSNNRNVTQMLEFLMMRGEVAIAGGWTGAVMGRLPSGCIRPTSRSRPSRRQSAGRTRGGSHIARHRPPEGQGDNGASARRRGRRAGGGRGRQGRVAGRPRRARRRLRGRTALLSPFDRLIHDRVRAEELFDFEYALEMYKPAAKRRWGYYALPILHEDRLVGKLDAVADRKASVLRVNAIHEDVKFTRTMTKAVQAELEDLASWLGLSAIESG